MTDHIYISLRLNNQQLDAIQLSRVECDMHRIDFNLIGVGGGGEFTYDYDFQGPKARAKESEDLLKAFLTETTLSGQVNPWDNR